MKETTKKSYLTFIKDMKPQRKEGGKYLRGTGLYKCLCGNTKEIVKYLVITGNTRSCGCIRKIKPVDYIPKGSKLTFIKDANQKFKIRSAYYLCECGKTKILSVKNVKCGNTTSCGCVRNEAVRLAIKTHGLSCRSGKKQRHPLHNVWSQMKSRCYNENHTSYIRYGAIGVRVCAEWRNSFQKFYDWCISNGWKNGKVVDKDIKAKLLGVKPKYCPKLCSITTQKENTQSKNKTRHKILIKN